jgi:hypothetical protein
VKYPALKRASEGTFRECVKILPSENPGWVQKLQEYHSVQNGKKEWERLEQYPRATSKAKVKSLYFVQSSRKASGVFLVAIGYELSWGFNIHSSCSVKNSLSGGRRGCGDASQKPLQKSREEMMDNKEVVAGG